MESLRSDLQSVLAKLGANEPAPHHPEQLRAEIESLTSELDAHFDYEEEQLIPALNTLTDPLWPNPR